MSMSSSQSLCSDYGDYDKYALEGEHVHYNADDRYHEDVEGVADDDHGDVEGVADDDRGDAKDNDETDDSLDDLNIAERVRLGRRSSLMKAAPISISTTSRECSTTSPEGSMSSSWTSAPKQAISLNDKSITLISRIAPNDVFSMRKSRRRRMKRMMNTIHPELKSVFKLSGPTAWTVWTGATSARPCWDTRCWWPSCTASCPTSGRPPCFSRCGSASCTLARGRSVREDPRYWTVRGQLRGRSRSTSWIETCRKLLMFFFWEELNRMTLQIELNLFYLSTCFMVGRHRIT